MRTTQVLGVQSIVCVAGLLWSGFGSVPSFAAPPLEVQVSVRVSAAGLDLTRQADVERFYLRLENAARRVCTNGIRVGLAPVDNEQACIASAVAATVRSVKAPLLTQLYLENHTPRQAEAAGLYGPSTAASLVRHP